MTLFRRLLVGVSVKAWLTKECCTVKPRTYNPTEPDKWAWNQTITFLSSTNNRQMMSSDSFYHKFSFISFIFSSSIVFFIFISNWIIGLMLYFFTAVNSCSRKVGTKMEYIYVMIMIIKQNEFYGWMGEWETYSKFRDFDNVKFYAVRKHMDSDIFFIVFKKRIFAFKHHNWFDLKQSVSDQVLKCCISLVLWFERFYNF